MYDLEVSWGKMKFTDAIKINHESDILCEISCPKDGVAIDIGAHQGFYTTKMTKDVGINGKVISFEPNIDNLKVLVENLRINDANCYLYNIALSNYNGDGILYTYRQGIGADSSKHFLRGSCEKEAFYNDFLNNKKAASPELDSVVKVYKLDYIIERDFNDLSKIDLIKIDVEGAELKVLEGGVKTLTKYSPKVVIEVHFDQIDDVIKYMTNLEYYKGNFYTNKKHNPIIIFYKLKLEV